jgi:hypothetical protein
VSLSLEGLADIVDGEVLLPQRNDLVTDRIPFRSTVRPFVRLEKEGAVGVLAELVAEHAETPGGIAKTLGDLLRGEALNKVRPECLVLPMGGSVGSRKTRSSSVRGFPVLINIEPPCYLCRSRGCFKESMPYLVKKTSIDRELSVQNYDNRIEVKNPS